MSAHRTHAIYDCNGALVTLATNNVPHAERLAHLYSTSSRKNKPFTARPVVVVDQAPTDALIERIAKAIAFVDFAMMMSDDEARAAAEAIDNDVYDSCVARARAAFVATTTPTQAET